MGALLNIAVLLVQTILGLFLLMVLLRLLLQIARADFYNPISQAIVKITDPALKPFRRLIPGFGGFDVASIILAFVVQLVAIVTLLALHNIVLPGAGSLTAWAFVGMLSQVKYIYYVCIFVAIIASFVAPYSHQPILLLMRQLSEPIMAPFRRLLPDMGGIDLSPIFVLLALQILGIILDSIATTTGLIPGLVVGY